MPCRSGSATATMAPPATTPLKNMRRGRTPRRAMSFLLGSVRFDEPKRVGGDEVQEKLVHAVAAPLEAARERVERRPVDGDRLAPERVHVDLAHEARARDGRVAN